MRISNLTVENFRSLETLSFNIPQVCAIVGPNNAGKSNILESLQRVLGTSWVSASSFTPNDVFNRDPDRDIKICCSVEPPIQYFKFQNAPSTDIHSISFEYTRYKRGGKKANLVWNRLALVQMVGR